MTVIFDGVCNLCETLVIFIIRRDRHSKFKFVQAQSETGKRLQYESGIDAKVPHSIMLVNNGTVLFKSDAVLEIARYLDGMWKLMYGFKIIPVFMRDRVYEYVANNRYRWFGQKKECMIPTKQIKERFLL